MFCADELQTDRQTDKPAFFMTSTGSFTSGSSLLLTPYKAIYNLLVPPPHTVMMSFLSFLYLIFLRLFHSFGGCTFLIWCLDECISTLDDAVFYENILLNNNPITSWSLRNQPFTLAQATVPPIHSLTHTHKHNKKKDTASWLHLWLLKHTVVAAQLLKRNWL